jgi:predicted transcriptional regulator
MKAISKETKTYKLFSALQEGEKLTAAQAAKRFGIKNISAEASRIRQHGYAVYANSKKAGNGVNVTTYELGRPSRNIVALGYKAAAMGITL